MVNKVKLMSRVSEIKTLALINGDLTLNGEEVDCDNPEELYHEIGSQLGNVFIDVEYEFTYGK